MIDVTESMIDVEALTDRAEEMETEAAEMLGVDEGELDDAHTIRALRKADHHDLADEIEELSDVLEELRGNGGDHQWRGDWYPATLIRNSDFEGHARELVEDCDGIPRDLPSYIEIDWEATARNVQQDYTSIEIRGVTYWYR